MLLSLDAVSFAMSKPDSSLDKDGSLSLAPNITATSVGAGSTRPGSWRTPAGGRGTLSLRVDWRNCKRRIGEVTITYLENNHSRPFLQLTLN